MFNYSSSNGGRREASASSSAVSWRGLPERSEKQAVDISHTAWFASAVNIFSMTNRYNPYSEFIILY